jgi:maltose O-acetyltransferase
VSIVGVPPLTEDQLSHRHGAAIGALPGDARGALRWLRRGRLVTSPLLPLAVRRWLLGLGGVKLGPMVWGLERCWLQSPHISIGTGSFVNAGCWFEGSGRIEIGHNCLIGPEVMILTSIHEISDGGAIAREPQQRPVTIGAGTWIGARATIMPGVEIGAGTVIAAGAVVTKDCEPAAVYGGIPARRIR